MSLQTLLRNFGDSGPSGDDLAYDQAFIELEIAAQPGEERQMGGEIVAAEEPDFKEVSEKAIAVLERSHDLRAAAHLALAELRLRGFPGLAEVTGYMRDCLEEYWDTCHPQLDPDDDNDPTMRANAVRALESANGVLRAVRLTPLTDSRTFGRFTLRDIAIAEGEVQPPEGMNPIPEPSTIAAAFKDTDPEALRHLQDAVTTAAGNVDAITAKFDAEVAGLGPDLDPLRKALRQVARRVGDALGGDVEESSAAEVAAPRPQAAGRQPLPRGGGAVGAINGPNDVIGALDRIMEYYARHEPSSPIPILLTRARRLVNADFLTIIKDIAPSGVENVNLVGGLSDESY